MNSYMRQTPISVDQVQSNGFHKDKQAWVNACAMYQGPDPLDHWYNYICWYENNVQRDPENKYREALEQCLTTFEHNDYYKQDPRMIRLWVKYIGMQPNPLHFYQILYQRTVGRQVALFYISWAKYYESINGLKEAEAVYNLGFREKAQPFAELQLAHNKLQFMKMHGAGATGINEQAVPPTHQQASQKPMPTATSQQLQQQTQQQMLYQQHGHLAAQLQTEIDYYSQQQQLHQQANAAPQVQVQNFRDQQQVYYQQEQPQHQQPQQHQVMIQQQAQTQMHSQTHTQQHHLQEQQQQQQQQHQQTVYQVPIETPVNSNGYANHVLEQNNQQVYTVETPRQLNHETYSTMSGGVAVQISAASIQTQIRQPVVANGISHQQTQQHSTTVNVQAKVQHQATQEHQTWQQQQQQLASSTQIAPQANAVKASTSNLPVNGGIAATASPLPPIKLPRKFVSYSYNNHEAWRPALFLEEPADPSRRCCYKKDRVYPGGDIEYSIEELRAEKYQDRLKAIGAETSKHRNHIQHHQPHHPEPSVVTIPCVPQHHNQQQQKPHHQPQQQPQQQQNVYATTQQVVVLHQTVQPQQVITLQEQHQQEQQQQQQGYIVSQQQHVQQNQNYHQMYCYYGERQPQQQQQPTQQQQQLETNQQQNYNNNNNSQMNHYSANQTVENYNSDNYANSEAYEDGDEDEEEYEDEEEGYSEQQRVVNGVAQPVDMNNTLGDLEDQIEASTIRFSMHSAQPATIVDSDSIKNKSLKIKFKKESVKKGRNKKGALNDNYSAYSVNSADYVESPQIRNNGHSHSFHPYLVNNASTPKVANQKQPRPRQRGKVKRANNKNFSFMSGAHDESSSSSFVENASETAYNHNNNNNKAHNSLHNATFNDNANFSFSSAAAFDNSNCSLTSAVDRLNFRDTTANSTTVGVGEISTYQENSYFATQYDTEAKERRLQKALKTIDIHLAKNALDPFNSELCRAFLTKLDFPDQTASNYKITQTPLPKLGVQRGAVSLPEIDGVQYSVDKEVGRGSYGYVYKATDLSSGDIVALKYQKPPNIWEIYICDQVFKRIHSPNILPGFMDISTAIIAPNASLMATEFSPFGTLLDVNNKIRQATSKVMHESLVMHFAAQICDIVLHLHKAKIIHADLKPDNFLLMRIPSVGLEYPSLRLIDFGCAIDMTLFPDQDKQKFRKVIQTDGFTCVEMQEGRPWSYETDLFCIAGTVHVILFGEYMQLQKSRQGTWDIKQKFPRYLKKHVWTKFFGEILNIKGKSNMPDLSEMRNSFNEESLKMESELQSQIRTLSNLLKRR